LVLYLALSHVLFGFSLASKAYVKVLYLAFFSKAYVKVLGADFLSTPLQPFFSLQQFPCNSFPFQKLPTPKSPKQKNQANAPKNPSPKSSPNKSQRQKSKKPPALLQGPFINSGKQGRAEALRRGLTL
jgi:hypothetical protein